MSVEKMKAAMTELIWKADDEGVKLMYNKLMTPTRQRNNHRHDANTNQETVIKAFRDTVNDMFNGSEDIYTASLLMVICQSMLNKLFDYEKEV